MGYDHEAEARRARRGVLAGHRPGYHRLKTITPTATKAPILARVGALCRQHPEYDRDGTRAMLERWIAEGQERYVDWYIAHCA